MAVVYKLALGNAGPFRIRNGLCLLVCVNLAMPNFKITYVDSDGVSQTIVKSFSDAGCISAYHYAEDFAYSLTDTGYFDIEILEEA